MRNWDGLIPALNEIWDTDAPRSVMVVTDKNVAKLCFDELWEMLARDSSWKAYGFAIEVGEGNKNMENLERLLEAFHSVGLDRQSVVLALGGGVVSDLAGFAAAVYMRGIAYANLPTTLLAQADSAIGGKTGIDFMGIKNLVGAFHQPRLVYSNLACLKTLTEADYISGLAEIIKCGIIKDRQLLEYMQANKDAILRRDYEALEHIIRRACEIKLAIVAADEKEKSLRQLLNFGHTFGHAIESYLAFALPHGHCVALGMLCALDYSARHRGLAQEEADFARGLIASFGLPAKLGHHKACLHEVYELMLKDKKATNAQLALILTPALGEAEIVTGHEESDVKQSIEVII